jgi:broad specificity phosphatase PhoE
MMEHRGNMSISSVSSGRNSSFDEADVIPPLAADVLVVSHGGLIKMLILHLVEHFHCKVQFVFGHYFIS